MTPQALETLKHSLIHRGDGKGRPDNTMEALLYTWAKGYTPESDIRYTKDGKIVAFHDNGLKGRNDNVQLHCQVRYDADGRQTFSPRPETMKKCVERLHAAGVEASMCVWQEEANRPETYLALWEFGFDSFGTDYPEALYKAVEILRSRVPTTNKTVAEAYQN